MMKLYIICVAFERAIPLRIMIDCLLTQTNPNWELHIIHDGPASDKIKKIISSYCDPRIKFEETPKRLGQYGHPNRNYGLSKLAFNHKDFVLITNDDNYYVPKFVEYMFNAAKTQVGMVYCDTVHNYINYDVLQTHIKVGQIDMGSFIVRVDVAKKVGFDSVKVEADGIYAVKCSEYCRKSNLRIRSIKRPLFIHN